MKVDRWGLVDGTILTSPEGHKVMIDGMVGRYIVIKDEGSVPPLPAPGWMAIATQDLVDHVNSGRWSVVDNAHSSDITKGKL